MGIVGAFDVHRRQLTFDYLDTVTGEVKRGRVAPADRQHLRARLARFTGQDEVRAFLEPDQVTPTALYWGRYCQAQHAEAFEVIREG